MMMLNSRSSSVVPTTTMVAPPPHHRDEEVDDNSGDVAAPVYIIIGLVGIVGNLITILVFRCTRRPIIPLVPRRFVLHQSIIDTFWSLFLILIYAVPHRELHVDAWLDQIYCKFWLSEYIFWILAGVSTFNLVALSLERYFALVHALWHFNHFSKRRNTGWLFLSMWVVSGLHQLHTPFDQVIVVLPSNLTSSNTTSSQVKCVANGISRDARIACGIINFLLKFVLPLVAMTAAYISMIHYLKRKEEHRGGKYTAVTGNSPASRNGSLQMTSVNENRFYNRYSAHSLPAAYKSSIVLRHTNRYYQREGAVSLPGGGPVVVDTNASPPGHKLKKQTGGGDVGVCRKARRNLIVTVWIIEVVFFICYAPNQILYFLHNLSIPVVQLGSTWHSFTVTLLFLNCCLNPLIYSFKLRAFQRELRRRFCRNHRRFGQRRRHHRRHHSQYRDAANSLPLEEMRDGRCCDRSSNSLSAAAAGDGRRGDDMLRHMAEISDNIRGIQVSLVRLTHMLQEAAPSNKSDSGTGTGNLLAVCGSGSGGDHTYHHNTR